MTELSDQLQSVADKIMAGDVLNIPLLSRPDSDRVSFHLIGILNAKITGVETALESIKIEMQKSKHHPKNYGKKR